MRHWDRYVGLAHADCEILTSVRSVVNIALLLHYAVVGEIRLLDGFTRNEAQIASVAPKLNCNVLESPERTNSSSIFEFGDSFLVAGLDNGGIGSSCP